MNSAAAETMRAIAQNNIAVSLMNVDDFASAVSNFSNALHAVSGVLHQQGNGGWQILSFTQRSTPMTTVTLDECMAPTSPTVNTTTLEDKATTHANKNIVYRHALRLPPVITGASHEATLVICCSVMFNLALALQLSSEGSSSSVNGSLVKAHKLYELCFNLQKHEKMENNLIFNLALVNNIGCIHGKLQDEMAQKWCFEFVLSSLMILTASGQGNNDQLAGFFVNAMSNGRNVAPAA